MPRFLVLYRSSVAPEQMMAMLTPEQQQKGMEMWGAWYERAKANVVDLGTPVKEAASLTGQAGALSEHVGGFSILQGDSVDDVTAALGDHPHFHAPGGSIQVFELMPVPGMEG